VKCIYCDEPLEVEAAVLYVEIPSCHVTVYKCPKCGRKFRRNIWRSDHTGLYLWSNGIWVVVDYK